MKIIQGTISISVLLIFASFILLACTTYDAGTQMSAEERKRATEAMLEWGRLAPFPTTAQEITIRTEGGLFSRTFRCHFKAPKSDIETWVRSSPGLLEAESTYGDRKTKYLIKPGGGANRAEVTIGDDGSVQIYTSWS
jgi:hypothetical protein